MSNNIFFLVPPTLPEFLGTIAGAMAYVVVLSLYYSCFRALLKRTPGYSKQKQGFMLAYITLMLLLSTLSLFQLIYVFALDLTATETSRSMWNSGQMWFLASPGPFLPFTIWGADGFMVIITLSWSNP